MLSYSLNDRNIQAIKILKLWGSGGRKGKIRKEDNNSKYVSMLKIYTVLSHYNITKEIFLPLGRAVFSQMQ